MSPSSEMLVSTCSLYGIKSQKNISNHQYCENLICCTYTMSEMKAADQDLQ
jgi:hypothetical protein